MTLLFFFFQAEDGIRDWSVTGVQTCALPICRESGGTHPARPCPSAWVGHPSGEVFAGRENWHGLSSPRHEVAAQNVFAEMEYLSGTAARSEERRVGKECRTGREPDHKQQKRK